MWPPLDLGERPRRALAPQPRAPTINVATATAERPGDASPPLRRLSPRAAGSARYLKLRPSCGGGSPARSSTTLPIHTRIGFSTASAGDRPRQRSCLAHGGRQRPADSGGGVDQTVAAVVRRGRPRRFPTRLMLSAPRQPAAPVSLFASKTVGALRPNSPRADSTHLMAKRGGSLLNSPTPLTYCLYSCFKRVTHHHPHH